MTREELLHHLKDVSRQMVVDKSWPVTEDELIKNHSSSFEFGFACGALWCLQNVWKPADGDDLPEYEREVVVLHQPYPLEGSEYAVGFAHRPDPKGWDGTNIATGKVEHHTPKTYDKGGWNIHNIKWFLDLELPVEVEKFI